VSPERTRTTVAELVDELRRLILSGSLLAGQALRQDSLAARFGVSRTPLREAVARLEVEGLVVTEPNRGAVVFRPSTRELEEIYDVRLMLEPQAAALAAVKREGEWPDELDALERLNDSMAGVAALEYARMNSEFHTRLYALSGQSRLCSIIRNLRLQADPYVSMLIGGGGGPQALDDHREIIRLVRAGDGAMVEELTREHLQHTVSRVMPMITRLHGDVLAADADSDAKGTSAGRTNSRRRPRSDQP
jgi:DNA-binding GntR family transcriptional regulator